MGRGRRETTGILLPLAENAIAPAALFRTSDQQCARFCTRVGLKLFDIMGAKCQARIGRLSRITRDEGATYIPQDAHHSWIVPRAVLFRPVNVDLVVSFAAAVIPLFLVVMFEVAYAVHKRRSVKFCGIVFDVRRAEMISYFDVAPSRSVLKIRCLVRHSCRWGTA